MTKPTSVKQHDIAAPLLLETLHHYAQQIFTPIRRKESVSTIWVPMLGRRVVNKFIINFPELFVEELGLSDKFLLTYIEPLELTEESATGYIKLIIKSLQESYALHYPKNNLPEFSESTTSYAGWLENLTNLIKKMASEGLQIVLFLGEYDELNFANQVFYNNLKSLWTKSSGTLNFVFLLQTDVSKPESLSKYGELNELILENVVYVPLLSDDDTNYKIDQFSQTLKRPFSKEEKILLVELCGGHPYLLKACTRLIAMMNGQRLEIPALKELLVNHFEPRSACQKIFNLLTPVEQNVLKKLNSYGTKLPTEADTLIKLGLVKQSEDKSWQPFGEIFKAVIEHQHVQVAENVPHSNGVSFDEKSGAIFIGDTNIEEKFTRQEYEILSFFLKEPNKLRSRDEIGEAMWGKDAYDKYSDWAIDQIMSKIRKKFQKVGAGLILTTVRGRGYKLTVN